MSIIVWPRVTNDGSGMINAGAVAAPFTVTPAVNFNPELVAPLAGASGYRIVSAGFKLRRISPMLTTSGTVFVRSHAVTSGSEFQPTYLGDTYQASKTVDIALQDCSEACFIFEHSSQMPQVFYPFSTNALVTADLAGFLPMTVSVSGGPVTTGVLQMELIVNIEYVFSPSAPLALAATPAPPGNALVTTVANRITSESSHFFSDAVGIVGAHLRKKATTYLANALGSSANPLLRLGGGALALTVD
jgi:hypothetical protein